VDAVQKKHKIQIVESEIGYLMDRGIILDDATVHYIDSTFACPGANNFREILAGSGDCETEPLLDLIFFPNIEMQEQLEPVLAAHGFDDNDVENLIRALQEKKIQVRILFPNDRGEFFMQAPEAAIRQMIHRFCIAKSIDARIISALQETIHEKSENYQIRVMLRNCRVLFFDSFVHALCQCIEIMHPASAYFRPAFAFLLDFLETAEPEKDIYAGLIRKKQMLEYMILQAERNEQALSKTSAEALMLSGLRIPAIHVGEARKKIAMIDHLCLSLYGKTEFTQY
jgi:hypothetical protein